MTSGIFLLVLTAAVCHAAWNFAVCKVSGNLVVIWLGIWAAFVLLLPGVVGLVVFRGIGEPLSSTGAICIIATGILHALYFLLLSRAYEHGEISVVYPIARGSGVGLTAILAWMLLREEISLLGAGGIGMVSLGILVMGAPAYGKRHRAREFKLVLRVGASIVAYSLVDKTGVSNVNPILYIWSMILIAGIVMCPYVLLRHGQEVAKTWREYKGYVLVIGVGAIGTYLMILFAFTMGPVSYIVALREFAVVVGAFLGIVLLKEKVTLAKLVAILAITVGMMCIKLS